MRRLRLRAPRSARRPAAACRRARWPPAVPAGRPFCVSSSVTARARASDSSSFEANAAAPHRRIVGMAVDMQDPGRVRRQPGQGQRQAFRHGAELLPPRAAQLRLTRREQRGPGHDQSSIAAPPRRRAGRRGAPVDDLRQGGGSRRRRCSCHRLRLAWPAACGRALAAAAPSAPLARRRRSRGEVGASVAATDLPSRRSSSAVRAIARSRSTVSRSARSSAAARTASIRSRRSASAASRASRLRCISVPVARRAADLLPRAAEVTVKLGYRRRCRPPPVRASGPEPALARGKAGSAVPRDAGAASRCRTARRHLRSPLPTLSLSAAVVLGFPVAQCVAGGQNGAAAAQPVSAWSA